MPIIETKKICQKYDSRYLIRDIDLEIERGEVFALIGPTGAGKTTLLRILDLIDMPFSGTISFNGIDITNSKRHQLDVRRKMSYVHEKKQILRQKTEVALELISMSEFKDRDARTLSGGETQRIAIARSLVTEPEVLFLDEPTANMDPLSANKVEEVLSRIIKDKKTTIVMTTHNMSQGQRLAGRIGVLIEGRLLQTGSAFDIFNAPETIEVAEFVGVENILSGIVVDKKEDLLVIRVGETIIFSIGSYEVNDKVNILVRPEMIIFTPSKDVSSARNVIKGKIVKINTVGSLVRIEIDCGFPLLGIITVTAAQELNISLGQEIYANFKATSLKVIKRWD